MVKKVIGAAAVVVLVAAGVFVWYFFVRDDSVDKATAECDPAPCEESTVESVDGSWAIDPDSSRGTIVITETIGGIADHQAEGRTGPVTGTVTVEGSQVTAADITVDMTGLEFTDAPPGANVANRANAMRDQGLQTDQFPEATFTLTEPIDVGEGLTTGEPVTATATGELTIHGVTQPVTFDVDVVADGETFRVTPNDFVPVVLADYGMSVEAPPFVADIADEGSFDFLLVLTQG